MISSIRAAQRLDSRGIPTVQVELTTEKGDFRAMVPSGASTGINEAVELRDWDESAYGGRGVQRAIFNIENIMGPHLVKGDFRVDTDQKKIDQLLKDLDGTKNKAKLGANAVLGISMACARAGAAHSGVPLYEFIRREAGGKKPFVMPVPFFNILNGGVHSGNNMAFQETMVAPVGASSMAEAIQIGSEVYQHLKEVIIENFGPSAIGIGDEGGFAPPISEPNEALDLLVQAVSNAGHSSKVKFAIDPASSEFFRKGRYDVGFKKNTNLKTPKELMGLYQSLLEKYPIILLDDPFAENDWDSWMKFKKVCPLELVGDDLLVTNTEYVKMARYKDACNGMLLKINQIGTISEAIEAAKLAFSYDWGVFVSHRSGETTDDFIADLVVGLRTGHIKSGAPCRGERVVKYNRLLDIEAEILAHGGKCLFAGSQFKSASKC